MEAISPVFNPPCEPIDEVMPPLGIEVMGHEILRGFLAREHAKGTDNHRVRDGDDGPFLPPSGRQAVIQGRQVRPLGARRGVGQLREDRPEGLVPRRGMILILEFQERAPASLDIGDAPLIPCQPVL
jgi:hypothetical protein